MLHQDPGMAVTATRRADRERVKALNMQKVAQSTILLVIRKLLVCLLSFLVTRSFLVQ